MDIVFKPILDKEADLLREIAIRTFRQSYEHLNTPANFNGYINRAFNTDRLISEIQNKERYYYFVILEEKIIGYLKLNIGSSQTETFDDTYLEIERIYLDASYQRKGMGSRMIAHATEIARSLQKTKIWLGVWDQNPKAILFYERMGFVRKGNHIFKFGDEDQNDIIMEKDV